MTTLLDLYPYPDLSKLRYDEMGLRIRGEGEPAEVLFSYHKRDPTDSPTIRAYAELVCAGMPEHPSLKLGWRGSKVFMLGWGKYCPDGTAQRMIVKHGNAHFGTSCMGLAWLVLEVRRLARE